AFVGRLGLASERRKLRRVRHHLRAGSLLLRRLGGGRPTASNARDLFLEGIALGERVAYRELRDLRPGHTGSWWLRVRLRRYRWLSWIRSLRRGLRSRIGAR